MIDARSRSALEIESELLSPGGRYLLASFAQPELEREQDLLEVGRWFGLEEALIAAGVQAPASAGATGRWLAALGWAAGELGSDAAARELVALTQALRLLADEADAGKKVSIDRLWTHMSQQLRGSLGLPRNAPSGEKPPRGRATKPATLRGRRWGEVRPQLASALQRLAAPRTDLLPRSPRSTSTFDGEHYEAVRSALRDSASGGLAVLAAPPGSGKTELALGYARHFRDDYDRVFFLRATDLFQLEQDFLAMARILVGSAGDPGYLRREAFRVLENSDRWLIIFNSVTDPGSLLPYLAWNPEGHKLCTYWAENRAIDDAWLTYFNVGIVRPRDHRGSAAQHANSTDVGSRDWAQDTTTTIRRSDDAPGLLEPMDTSQALRFLARTIDDVRPDSAELTQLAALVAPSRLAAVIAARWISYSQESISAYLARWRRLVDDWERFATDPSQDREPAAPSPPGYESGLRAVLLTLLGLTDATRRDVPARGDAGSAELAAVVLLVGRLEPYRSGSFPAEILDDLDWRDGRSGLDDRRLVVLHELALAAISDGGPYFKDFTINPIVHDAALRLEAAWRLDADPRSAGIASRKVGIASRTILRLTDMHARRGESRAQLDLLPHVERLALRAAPERSRSDPSSETRREHDGPSDIRPLVAIEMHARAAACHLGLRRIRPASAQLARIDHVVNDYPAEIRAALGAAEIDWGELPGHPPQYDFGSPIGRLWQLMRSLRIEDYPQVAYRLFVSLQPALSSSSDALQTPDRARLYFEGALACRARSETTMDPDSHADDAIKKAFDLWTELGEEQGKAAAWDVMAVLALDRGDLETAYDKADKALKAQEPLLRPSTTRPLADPRAELARSLSLLARIRMCEGRVKDAAARMRDSTELWRTVAADPATQSRPRINAVSARSRQALLTAILGDVRTGEQEALSAQREADAIYLRGHRKKALIVSNTAQVLRLGGEIVRAREMHAQALDMSERLWGPDHMTTTDIRRSCADTLLDAGKPRPAVIAVLKVLQLLGVGPSTGDVIVRGRTWTSLGRALIETSVSLEPDQARSDATLDLGRQALEHANALFDAASTDSVHRHPDAITCLLGRAEVALRKRDAAAVRLAQEATDLARAVLVPNDVPDGASPVLIGPRARLLRARTLTASMSELNVLKRDADSLDAQAGQTGAARTPTTQLEIALAVIAVDAAILSLSESARVDEAEALHARARVQLAAALKGLRERLREEPHQLIARGYAELAKLAENFLTPRQRARDERERDRARPRFEVEEFRTEIIRRLVRSEDDLAARRRLAAAPDV